MVREVQQEVVDCVRRVNGMLEGREPYGQDLEDPQDGRHRDAHGEPEKPGWARSTCCNNKICFAFALLQNDMTCYTQARAHKRGWKAVLAPNVWALTEYWPGCWPELNFRAQGCWS